MLKKLFFIGFGVTLLVGAWAEHSPSYAFLDDGVSSLQDKSVRKSVERQRLHKDMPLEAFKHMLSFLTLEDLGRARRVCQDWKNIINKKENICPQINPLIGQGFSPDIFIHMASFLDDKWKKALPCVCKNWKMAFKNPTGLNFKHLSDNELAQRLLLPSTNALSMIDAYDPLDLHWRSFLEGGRMSRLLHRFPAFRRFIQHLAQENQLNKKKLKTLLTSSENQRKFHRHLTALRMLSASGSEEDLRNLEKIGTVFSTFLPTGEIGDFAPLTFKWNLKKKYSWLVEQPFWAAFFDMPEMWQKSLGMWFHYLVVGWPAGVPEQSSTRLLQSFKNVFPQQKYAYKSLIETILSFSNLNKKFCPDLFIFRQQDFSYFGCLQNLAEGYILHDKYEEAFGTYRDLLAVTPMVRILEEEKRPNLRSLILKKFLKTIFKSPVVKAHLMDAENLLTQLEAASAPLKKQKKVDVWLVYPSDNPENIEEVNHEIIEGKLNKKAFRFYKRLINFMSPDRTRESAFTKKEIKDHTWLFLNALKVRGMGTLSLQEQMKIRKFLKSALGGFKKILKIPSYTARIILQQMGPFLPDIQDLFAEDKEFLSTVLKAKKRLIETTSVSESDVEPRSKRQGRRQGRRQGW